MKKTMFFLSALMIFALLLQSCSSSNKMPVTGENKDLSADFKDIKTYAWTSNIDNIPSDKVFVGPNGVLIFNNESGRKMIKDAIEYELDAKGYKKVSSNPDMLVSFLILEQPASLRTTEGYATVLSGKQVRTDDNISYTDVKPGTLIVNFMNADNNKQIWQGFVSGILKANEMKDQSMVRNAVSKVFQQFDYSNSM